MEIAYAFLVTESLNPLVKMKHKNSAQITATSVAMCLGANSGCLTRLTFGIIGLCAGTADCRCNVTVPLFNIEIESPLVETDYKSDWAEARKQNPQIAGSR